MQVASVGFIIGAVIQDSYETAPTLRQMLFHRHRRNEQLAKRKRLLNNPISDKKPRPRDLVFIS